jgi:hypothetical protein
VGILNGTAWLHGFLHLAHINICSAANLGLENSWVLQKIMYHPTQLPCYPGITLYLSEIHELCHCTEIHTMTKHTVYMYESHMYGNESNDISLEREYKRKRNEF